MNSILVIDCWCVFLLSMLFAGILIPQILLIAFRKKLFDVPDERKIHHSAVPRLGGIAFSPVVCIVIAMVLGINCLFGNYTLLQQMDSIVLSVSWGLCSLLVLYLVGMCDDLIGVRYLAKFIVQILCAVMLILGGMGVVDYQGLFWLNDVSPWIGYPFTVFFVVFVLNAINLIDGIDGLASGLSAIAFILYGVYFALIGQIFYSLVAFATLGVLGPFFYFNVYGRAEKRKKIFMGDTGSLTIGLLIVYLGLSALTLPAESATGIRSSHTMVIVLSPLLVPCFDVVRVYFHRVRQHHNPFLPDKNHIHHKLLAVGYGQRTAMITIVSVSAVTCVFNILVAPYANVTAIIIFDIAVWTLWNVWLRNIINKKEASASGK